MPRSRNIKPAFFVNEKLADKDPLARLAFIGLWCLADREGRLEDRPKRIKAELLPYDNCDMDVLLESLNDGEFIMRYQVDDKPYIQIINFIKHQNPHHKEVASVIPSQSGWIDSGSVPSTVTEKQKDRIKARDNYICLKCGTTKNLTVDHIIPVSKGGSSDDDNLQTLCYACNTSKGNRHQTSYLNQH